MLRRLAGAQFYEEMTAEVLVFLESRRGVAPLGSLVGDAQGGDPVTTLFLDTQVALAVIGWLEGRDIDPAITQQQRDLLRYGLFSSAAWSDLHLPYVAAEIGITLPTWYNESLFRQEMSRNIELLRLYIDAVERYRAAGGNQLEVVDILRRIVQQVNAGAEVLEAIRADGELTLHAGYQMLWPMPRDVTTGAVGGQGAPPTHGARQGAAASQAAPAPPDRPPNVVAASLFLSFSTSQEAILRRAINEHTARVELLDRFSRFAARAEAEIFGDQRVYQRPGGANAPPIPARMSSYPALEPPLFDAALDTDHVFSMRLQYSNVFEAFSHYG